MNGERTMRLAGKSAFLGLCLCLLLFPVCAVQAERLPFRSYSIEDGLPGYVVHRIVTDSSGFLWILTDNGVARFDGQEFDILDAEDGLPHSNVYDLLESSTGELWIATRDGLCRFRSDNHEDVAPCDVFRPETGGASNIVMKLLEDSSGRLWVGTVDGLFRLERDAKGDRLELVDLGPAPEQWDRHQIHALMEDSHGTVWVGTAGRLFRVIADGAVVRQKLEHEAFAEDLAVLDLLEDREGRLWVATQRGLGLLVRDHHGGEPHLSRFFTAQDGLPAPAYSRSESIIVALAQTPDGRIWIAAIGGLSEYQPDQADTGPAFRTYTRDHGLNGTHLQTLSVDTRGNLWIGSGDRGISKLTRGGPVSFTEEDGLGDNWISALFEDRSGALCVASGLGNVFIARFDGRRFKAVRPPVPDQVDDRGWGWGQITFQDHRGEWWVPTFRGLFRYPNVASFAELDRVPPKRSYTEQDGLASYGIFRLYPDSRGDIWIGTLHYAEPPRSTVQRWDRETDSIEDYSDVKGIPLSSPTAFLELPSGDLWIGFDDGTVGRLRDRRFTPFSGIDGHPAGRVEQLYLDGDGEVWIVHSRGLLRAADPDADLPAFVSYSADDGMSSNWLRCIVEGSQGRLYVGTSRGIERLDKATGHFDRHLSVEDGLAHHHAVVAHRDGSGALWFGTVEGLSRFVPETEPKPQAPAVWIRRLKVAGEPVPMPALGQAAVTGLRLPPAERNLELEYSGLGLVTGGTLRFQYRLRGASDEWSAPAADRTVNFASLSPGRYRFEVQAVSVEGLVSPEPAVVSFRVLPPFWRSWWFTALALTLVAFVAYAFHRLRLRRVVELERVRTRIATDLHDDIGSSLSRVSILSEVVRQQVQGEQPEEAEPLLTQIADTARDLVDSMSDIVWAVNPKRDRAADLVQRMRRFAGDTCSGRGIALRFRAPEDGQDRRLDLELRRQVYLIFKEAVNNAVRHSGCTRVEIEFKMEGKSLVLRIEDDGRGFDTGERGDGHGLKSMRQRAEGLKGRIEIISKPGEGTEVRVQVPLN
jgi:ligand-binding sensor domain-containing protein/signal transduction histidine kinase